MAGNPETPQNLMQAMMNEVSNGCAMQGPIGGPHRRVVRVVGEYILGICDDVTPALEAGVDIDADGDVAMTDAPPDGANADADGDVAMIDAPPADEAYSPNSPYDCLEHLTADKPAM